MANEHQRTFFTTLGTLEDEIITRGVNAVGEQYNERVKYFLSFLIHFVKEANWTDSVSSKLICKYYRESDRALCEYWKSCYGKAKSEHTFRSQRATLGKTLEGMFGSRNHVEEAFLQNDPENEDLKEIVLRIRTFSLDDLTLSDFLDCQTLFELTSKLPILTDKDVDIKTCQREVMFLAGRSSYNLDACIEALDKNKLAYICNLLKAPLFNKGKVNDGKVVLLNMLHSGLKDVSSIESTTALNDFMRDHFESIESYSVSTNKTETNKGSSDGDYDALLAENEQLKVQIETLRQRNEDISTEYHNVCQKLNTLKLIRDTDGEMDSIALRLQNIIEKLEVCGVDVEDFEKSGDILAATTLHDMVLPSALLYSLEDVEEVSFIDPTSTNYVIYKALLMLVCMFDVANIGVCVPRVAKNLGDNGLALGYLKHFLSGGQQSTDVFVEVSNYVRENEEFTKMLGRIFGSSDIVQTDSKKYRDIEVDVDESKSTPVVTSFSDDVDI